MKDPVKNFGLKFASVALLSLALSVQGQIFTLEDGNSVAQINAGAAFGTTPNGMYQWLVDGRSQLQQQWFWYRVGATGPESAIDKLQLVGYSLTNLPVVAPNQLTLNYASTAFRLDIDYVLRGGAAGSGGATIGEGIRISNITDSVLNFHFFQYSDFNLAGTTYDTRLQLGVNNNGLFNEALQEDGSAFFVETANSPGANQGMVAAYPVLLNLLGDSLPTDLGNVAGPITNGDLTWALQWDFNIPAHESVIISKLKLVPEPTSAALLGLGLGVWALRRRNSR